MNEWGIPEWRVPTAYGDVKGWDFFRWRWEFYRRRDDLRAYFDANVQRTYDYYIRLKPDFPPPNSPESSAMVDLETREKFGYGSIPNPRFGDQSFYSISAMDSALRFFEGDCSEKGNIGARLDLADVSLSARQIFILEDTLKCVPIDLSQNETAIIFDLSKPIEPQIAQARNMLRSNQEQDLGVRIGKRRHPDKWLGYLRTLDARAGGASWAEIAEIHPYTAQTEQSARDIWAQANALCFNF